MILVILGIVLVYLSIARAPSPEKNYFEYGTDHLDLYCGYDNNTIFWTDLNTQTVYYYKDGTHILGPGICLSAKKGNILIYRDGNLHEMNVLTGEENVFDYIWCDGRACVDKNSNLVLNGTVYDLKTKNPLDFGHVIVDSLGNIIFPEENKVFSFPGWSFGHVSGGYVFGGSDRGLAKVYISGKTINFYAIPLNVPEANTPVKPATNKFKGPNYGILVNGGFVIEGDKMYLCPGRTVEYFDGKTIAGQTLDGNVFIFKGDFRELCPQEKNVSWSPVFVLPQISKLKPK